MARFEASLAGAIAPDAEALRAQLTACLSSMLLENVAALFAFESWLLGRLWQYRARAEPVLELAISSMKWRESRAGSPAAALVAYSDNVQRLRTLGTQHPRALRALTQPPHTARLWSQILLFGVDQQLRASWEALEGAGAMLPETVDRAALAWWCRYFSHPQPSAALLRLAAVALVPLSALLGAREGSSSDRSVLFATLGAAVGALGSGAIIAAVWAIQRIWHRMKGQLWLPTPWQRLGWLPASLLLCCVAPFVGKSVFAAMVTAVLVIGRIGWAGWASIATYQEITPRHIQGVLILNVPVFLWLKILSTRSTEQLTLALWFSALGAIAAFTAGSSRLALEFRSSLAPRFQQGARLCLTVISLLGVLLLIRAAIEPPWTRLAAAVIVSLVLLQRTPAGLGLRRAQLKARYWATLAASLFVLMLVVTGLSPLRVGGVALLLGIVLTMLTCEWNEWAARRQAVRPAEARAGL
jgi:hypothetical protein